LIFFEVAMLIDANEIGVTHVKSAITMRSTPWGYFTNPIALPRPGIVGVAKASLQPCRF